jgi:predicted DNA-binding protein with PD1-like motif
MVGLVAFATEEGIGAGDLSAIGAFSAATVGYLSRERMEPERISVEEQEHFDPLSARKVVYRRASLASTRRPRRGRRR